MQNRLQEQKFLLNLNQLIFFLGQKKSRGAFNEKIFVMQNKKRKIGLKFFC